MNLEREKQKLIDDQHFNSKQPKEQVSTEDIVDNVSVSQPEDVSNQPEVITLHPQKESQTKPCSVKPKPEYFNLPANLN
jgi:hypothetical protein